MDARWIADDGHAWLRVPRAEVEALDIEVSHYSYLDDVYIYLEEDMDAAVFLLRLIPDGRYSIDHKLDGELIEYERVDGLSEIRNLDSVL